MKDPKSLHLKLQEYADCYSESDAGRELKEISEKGAGGGPAKGPGGPG